MRRLPLPAEPGSTLNRYALGLQGDRLVSLVLDETFDRSQALNLAAYLLVMAECIDPHETENDRTDQDFHALVEKIRAT